MYLYVLCGTTHQACLSCPVFHSLPPAPLPPLPLRQRFPYKEVPDGFGDGPVWRQSPPEYGLCGHRTELGRGLLLLNRVAGLQVSMRREGERGREREASGNR